jgi:hypothetical protein
VPIGWRSAQRAIDVALRGDSEVALLLNERGAEHFAPLNQVWLAAG